MKNNIKLVAVDIDGTFGKRSNFKICANSSMTYCAKDSKEKWNPQPAVMGPLI